MVRRPSVNRISSLLPAVMVIRPLTLLTSLEVLLFHASMSSFHCVKLFSPGSISGGYGTTIKYARDDSPSLPLCHPTVWVWVTNRRPTRRSSLQLPVYCWRPTASLLWTFDRV